MHMIVTKKRGKEKLLINFARIVFLGLIFFEFLNVLKIVRLNTQFTWLGLLITAIALYALLETVARRYERNKGHRLHWSVWIIAAYALSLDAAGDFFFLYHNYAWWNRVVHF